MASVSLNFDSLLGTLNHRIDELGDPRKPSNG